MATPVKTVDEPLLEEVVRRIVAAVRPEKIILFGSYAYGTPGPNSDLDLLVIMSSDLPRHKRAALVYRALAGLVIPKDVVVYTPEEVEEWREVPRAFITEIVRKGRVLYDKDQGRPGSGLA